MAEQAKTVAPAATAVVLTEAELMAELEKALASKDFKAVATASRKLDTAVKAVEKAALDAKRAILDKTTDKVKALYIKHIYAPMHDKGELDAGDGIWISHDFGDEAPTVRMLKTQPKAKGSGKGGTGKKFDISTDDMLARHGQEEYKDGETFQQAHEKSTDKNWRFAIRKKLLQKEGLI